MTPDDETQFLLDRLGGGAKLVIDGLQQLAKAETERDRYRRALDDALEELKRGNVGAAESWLRAALDR